MSGHVGRPWVAWAVAATGALVAWRLAGTGFANYDTAYALVWGRDLAHGRLPDYSVPVAPTPHPLANAVGLVLSPLGAGAESAWVLLAFLALGALTGLTYAIGTWAFGPAAGALAAAIVVTREPVLSFGASAYVDIPYVAFLLWALLNAVQRPRAGAKVLLPLTLAGLLRPEAWLFAALYVAYRWFTGARNPRALAPLAALAASAPAVWLLADLLVAGDALHSLVGTRANAEVLLRRTGLDELPITAPRRLGEILREPALAGAVLGAGLALAFLPRRSGVLAATAGAALLAFAVLAAAGLPILGRYLLAPAAILAVFCAAGVFGWSRLPSDHPWRRRWQAGGVLVTMAFVAFLPAHVDRLARMRSSLALQQAIRSDLHALTPTMAAGCLPAGVPNHRPVPLLALWLDRPPSAFVSAQLERLEQGQYLDPANAVVQTAFMLDPNDPGRLTAEVPPGFRERSRNRSWRVYGRCGPASDRPVRAMSLDRDADRAAVSSCEEPAASRDSARRTRWTAPEPEDSVPGLEDPERGETHDLLG